MHRLPNLWKSRHGIYYFRYFENGAEVKRSLGTKDWHRAKIGAFQLHIARDMTNEFFNLDDVRKLGVVMHPDGTVEYDIKTPEDVRLFQQMNPAEKLKLMLAKAEKHAEQRAQLATAPAAIPTSPPTIKTKLYSVVVSLYLDEKKLSNGRKTLSEKTSKYAEFKALFGDPDMNSIVAETAISYKQRLISDGLTTARINKTVSFFTDLFNYAIQNKYYFHANPFDGLAMSKKGKARKVKSYLEFSEDELKTIFNSKDEHTWMVTTMNKVRPHYFWLPFMALFSGARIGELAALRVSEVKQENDIWYFDIIEEDDEGVKNDNSVRKVPIHKKLVEMGFLTHVDSLKDKEGLLFPELKGSMNGYGKNMSRRFNEEYLPRLGIKHAQKKFHSFRSTFINRMTYMNVHPAILQSIVGHYKQDKVDFSSAHFSVYQQQKPIKVMKDVMDHLDYPEVKFSLHMPIISSDNS